ncbi:hypothetical protein [Marinitenerispora sediminis]|uniref:DUF2269 domain-containing protein n=1 Tax=Marinitenerispora sediminis TaxID=1931232 RepID=A0A368T643_9ACTN|nr:hypothetical protein [Marinitenerispora sediminis]RCV51726.1 hypothetical protein DEF28_14855 [Marinitenerispora sediminis]RCV55109.1 hypothetical protein DEF23_14840 [Marinitenerispora sediminis]RCV59076.1 hypothetical protein DEF24_11005 [Marinitenerispora sediminis]
MTKILLSAHVLAAIIAIGPVTVAASMFPAAVRRAQAAGGGSAASSVATVRLLHRICRVYAAVGITVPIFGFATASSLGVLTDPWLIASIALTAAAAGILALLVLPGQQAALARLDEPGGSVERRTTVRLAMLTGVFNLLWAVVTVLMIVRPGSTTGV